MDDADSVRLDKWLWAVRVFKTRALATEACRLGRVRVGGQPAKPSRIPRVGERVVIDLDGLRRTLCVKQVLDRRVGAGLVGRFVEEETPAADVERARRERAEARASLAVRRPGSGRPTKAQRRALERWARPVEPGTP
jgi:ribosome-associated heat shock protein Hsp15